MAVSLPDLQPREPQPIRPLRSKIHGTWQLVSYLVEAKANGETFPPMGSSPKGFVIFTPEGRLSFMLSAAQRHAAESTADQANLLISMIAHMGTY